MRKLTIIFCLIATTCFAQDYGQFDLSSAKRLGYFDPNSAKQIGDFAVTIGGTPAESCTDYIDYSNSSNRDLWMTGPGRYSGNEYMGIVFDDGATGDICEVSWWIGNTGGNPALNDFYCEIFLLSGSDFTPASPITNGRSDKVDGAYWTGQMVTFTFSTPPTYDCTGANQYAIVLKSIDSGDAATTVGEVDGTNYVSIGGDNEADSMTGNEGWTKWNSSGTGTTVDADDDPIVLIRTMQ